MIADFAPNQSSSFISNVHASLEQAHDVETFKILCSLFVACASVNQNIKLVIFNVRRFLNLY